MTPKPKRRLQLAAAVQTFKKFLKTEKLVLFCQINLDKTTAFSPVRVKSGSSRMTKEMRLIFEKGKWNDKRDTPAAAPPPCRLHFLMFSALHAEKAALLRRKNAFGRTTALLAPRMPSQNKKAIPYGMTFCFGGDKRNRTADLMTARWHRFVISGVFCPIRPFSTQKVPHFVPFCPLRPRAFPHTWVTIWVRGVGWIWRGSAGVDVDCNLNFVDSQVIL